MDKPKITKKKRPGYDEFHLFTPSKLAKLFREEAKREDRSLPAQFKKILEERYHPQ